MTVLALSCYASANKAIAYRNFQAQLGFNLYVKAGFNRLGIMVLVR